MTFVRINDNGIESYLFIKRLCKVDWDKSIYYVIFEAAESKYNRKRYIAISNTLFEYHDAPPLRVFPWQKKNFLASYDIKNQIVIPYDEKTISLLQVNEWHVINSSH